LTDRSGLEVLSDRWMIMAKGDLGVRISAMLVHGVFVEDLP
jgi:hypothetical protein